MAEYIVQNLRSNNDRNGNPQRVWVFYDAGTGAVVEVVDEGYIGRPRGARSPNVVELPSVFIPVSEYRRWLKRAK